MGQVYRHDQPVEGRSDCSLQKRPALPGGGTLLGFGCRQGGLWIAQEWFLSRGMIRDGFGVILRRLCGPVAGYFRRNERNETHEIVRGTQTWFASCSITPPVHSEPASE